MLGPAILYFMALGELKFAVLAVSALIGSFSISYVRARAECEVDDCRVGFWERGERLVYLSLGLVLNNVGTVLWVLAIATHFTAFQRLFSARQSTAVSMAPTSFLRNLLTRPPSRNNAAYLFKAGILFFLILLIKVPF